MPAIDILSSLSADLGVSLNTASEKAYLLKLLNDVAREKYVENDLKNCEREQVFQYPQAAQQIALPQYVDKVIAIRDYTTRLPVTQLDMRPRYMSNTWRQPFLGYPYFKHRLKGNSPIKSDLTTTSYLTIVLPSANTKNFSVIVAGETANAKRAQEVVLFQVGDTSKNTVSQFSVIETIRKSSATDVDVYVNDINGIELAVIPNNETTSVYRVYQVLDRNEFPSSSMLYEVLYKTRFVPFVNDYDDFVCGDFYDESLYWAVLAKYFMRNTDTQDKAMLCHNKAEACMTRIALNKDGPIDVNLKFGKQQVFNFFSRAGQSITTAKPYRPLYSNSLR